MPNNELFGYMKTKLPFLCSPSLPCSFHFSLSPPRKASDYILPTCKGGVKQFHEVKNKCALASKEGGISVSSSAT